MPLQPSDPAPREDWPREDWPGEDWPGEDWPGDEWPDDRWPQPPGSRSGRGGPGGPSPVPPGVAGDGPRKHRTVAVTALAVAAAGAGAAAALVLLPAPSAPHTAGPAQASQPPYAQVPPGGRAGAGGLPGNIPNGAQLFMAGTVQKVSPTSITLGGPGHTITAAVTGSTRVTGNVSTIRGIRAGDQVSAQLTSRAGTVTALAIQDPAQLPGGGSPP